MPNLLEVGRDTMDNDLFHGNLFKFYPSDPKSPAYRARYSYAYNPVISSDKSALGVRVVIRLEYHDPY